MKQGLETLPASRGFCGVFTCDLEVFDAFTRQCRDLQARPPSLYAYVARCLGVTLTPRIELLATHYDGKLLVPSRVDVSMSAEVSAYDGSAWPRQIGFHDLGGRSLREISDELTTRLREEKRSVEAQPVLASSRFIPEGAPPWWGCSVEALRAVRHRRSRQREGRERAMRAACVHLSSTAQWMQGYTGWGVELYTHAALSVTLAGFSRRPVVVGEQIVARQCLDVAIHFDHAVTDGAPATRFISTFIEELESGRALIEYSMVPRKLRRPKRQNEADYDAPDRNADGQNVSGNENQNLSMAADATLILDAPDMTTHLTSNHEMPQTPLNERELLSKNRS